MIETLNMFTLRGLWTQQSGEQNWQRGNPTKSYSSKQPLKIAAEVIKWEGHSPKILNNMMENWNLRE